MLGVSAILTPLQKSFWGFGVEIKMLVHWVDDTVCAFRYDAF